MLIEMSLDRIRTATLADARSEAERIENTARAHREERLEGAREALDAEFARRREQAQNEVRRQNRRQVVMRRSEHNLALLERRNEILDDLFNQAADRLADMPDEEYCAVIEDWMQALPPDVGGTVVCSERDEERLSALAARLNDGRPEEARLRMDLHWGPLRGGVVFQTPLFEIDLSLDARLRRLREALAPEAARLLFPEQTTV
jgi:vacuolar-type H+-ATPase subunit E/Vma4